jgi:hypothetical protein
MNKKLKTQKSKLKVKSQKTIIRIVRIYPNLRIIRIKIKFKHPSLRGAERRSNPENEL